MERVLFRRAILKAYRYALCIPSLDEGYNIARDSESDILNTTTFAGHCFLQG